MSVTASLDAASLGKLRENFRGQLILPGDRESSFFARADVVDRCDEVARLDLTIEQLLHALVLGP